MQLFIAQSQIKWHVYVCFYAWRWLFALTFALSSGAIISSGKMCGICISFTMTTTTKMEKKEQQSWNTIQSQSEHICLFHMDAAINTIHTRLSVKLTFDYSTVHKIKSKTHMNVVPFLLFFFLLWATKANTFAKKEYHTSAHKNIAFFIVVSNANMSHTHKYWMTLNLSSELILNETFILGFFHFANPFFFSFFADRLVAPTQNRFNNRYFNQFRFF